MNPKLDSGFPLEISLFLDPMYPQFNQASQRRRGLGKLLCVPLACSTLRLVNQVSHGQVKAGGGEGSESLCSRT